MKARLKGGAGPREVDSARKPPMSSFAAGSDPNQTVEREDCRLVPEPSVVVSDTGEMFPVAKRQLMSNQQSNYSESNDMKNEGVEEIKHPIEQVAEYGRAKESGLERENEMGKSECKYSISVIC
eukprot:TRINITY_DN12009_c0_g1_i1.p3 TRINITY_DN12009_c0_g1~~TRINITY_DN12009_c0_g1_i1.p3  ORF type:complete len:124 (+),score=28.05 TRINITY_DN12009_c0_g1_i1:245-616(+)